MSPAPSCLEPLVAVAAATTATAGRWAVAVASLLGAVTIDPEPAHVVGTGGAIGAVLRYWVGQRLSSDRFPWGTLTVNVVGSFVFGLAVFAGAGESTIRLVGVGACGSFTTFSSFSVQTIRLYERGNRALAVANATGTLACSLAAIALAWGAIAVIG